ncbi:hypothetical protein ACLPHM_09770 [Paenalcaligenes sp. Me131]|uniref:hypothetical protein n=1 Tax=Paenalcaligenes sp. Me131 TaxID=3392636 RepID=UPI003D2D1C87
MSRPQPLMSVYNFTSAQEPVILSKGTVEVSLDGTVYRGTADLLLPLIPSPRLIFHASLQGGEISPLVFAFKETTESSFSFSGLGIEGFCGARKVGENFENWELDWHPKFEPLVLCDMQSKNSVSAIFHLFNFPDFNGGQYQDAAPAGCAQLILTSEEWTFSLQALPDGATREAWKRIKAEGVCCLTHMVKLERNDGKPFSGKDAGEQCHLLDNFLAFVKGGWCTAVCGVGLAGNGEKTWTTFASPRTSNPPYSWFTPFKASQAERLFPMFANRWQQSDEWRECLQTVIYWYTQANTSGRSLSIDTAIILAQVALERLAHQYIVVDRKMVSGKGFDDLWASDRLRMLFSLCGIPSEITHAVPDISKKNDGFSNSSKWLDGPHAIADIRNSLVHPVSKKDVRGCYVDAWKLSLWYLELSVLALCGYGGTYTNRLTATYTSDSESVPWGQKA